MGDAAFGDHTIVKCPESQKVKHVCNESGGASSVWKLADTSCWEMGGVQGTVACRDLVCLVWRRPSQMVALIVPLKSLGWLQKPGIWGDNRSEIKESLDLNQSLSHPVPIL